jgi:hypothetical protein
LATSDLGSVMASDNSSGPGPAPIVLRIKLRYDDVELMIQRFSSNVGKSGLFLPTKSLQPIGAEVKFELRLADDSPALVGLGRVKAATPPDPHDPKAAFGIAIELMRVTPQSRALILRMLEHRRAVGLPEIGLPTAADIDHARREDSAGAVRAPPAEPIALAEPRDEPLLTAPRRTSAAIPVSDVQAAAPLGPEPVRRKRVALSELIDSASRSASGAAVALPGLDDEVDVAAAISRARSLAGAGLDAELDQLAEQAAAPIEISIEAASAELARQLGGSAVRRDRSARWATPPATQGALAEAVEPVDESAASAAEASEPVDEFAASAAEASEPVDEFAVSVSEASEPVDEFAVSVSEASEPVDEFAVSVSEASEPVDEFAVSAAEAADAVEAADPAVAVEPIAEPAVDPAAESAGDPADEFDLDDAEHTEMGGAPSPGDADELDLASALGIAADRELVDDGDDGGDGDDRDDDPHDVSLEEIEDFEILAEADADDEDLLAAPSDDDLSDRRVVEVELPVGPPAEGESDFAAQLDLGDEDGYFAVSATELASSHLLDEGVSGRPRRGSRSNGHDRAARQLDPHVDSAGLALAAFEPSDDLLDLAEPRDPIERGLGVQPIFEPEPSSSITMAGELSESFDLDIPSSYPVPAAPPRPSHEPAVRRAAPAPTALPSLYDSPVEDFELEHALEALDVDLDDLSIPHAATELQRGAIPQAARQRAAARGARPAGAAPAQVRPARRLSGSTSAPSRRIVASRPPSDDGIAIEFEEED